MTRVPTSICDLCVAIETTEGTTTTLTHEATCPNREADQ